MDSYINLWKAADAVCFDVDSTVCKYEGIDVLATFCGIDSRSLEQVATYTCAAMNGTMSFGDALAARLEIIRPSRSNLIACLAAHPVSESLTPGIVELVALLENRQVPVFLISGGFRQMILPVVEHLKIPSDHLYANVLLFHDKTNNRADEEERYRGFDPDQPTAKTGGKRLVCEQIIKQYGFQRLCMVGDGETDRQAKPPASLFIGFGGIVARPSIRDSADWFVTSFEELIQPLSRQQPIYK